MHKPLVHFRRTLAAAVVLLGVLTSSTLMSTNSARADTGAPSNSECEPPPAGWLRAENEKATLFPPPPFHPQGSSAAVQIYVDKPSYSCGQSVTAVVGTPSLWRLEIWRTGYYNGQRGRLVWASGVKKPFGRILPVQSQARAGSPLYGLVSAKGGKSLSVPLTGVFPPGVYVARAQLLGGDYADALFTVRSPAVTATSVFVESWMTFQEYNIWGGASGYRLTYIPKPYRPKVRSPLKLPQRFAETVSERRPWASLATFNDGDFSLLTFLESQGRDMDYLSDVDLDTSGVLLGAQSVILGQHLEYISVAGRRALQHAVETGTNLVVWGGNEFNWKVDRLQTGTSRAQIFSAKVQNRGLFDNDPALRGETLGGTGTGCVDVYANLTTEHPDNILFDGLSASQQTNVPGLFVREVDNAEGPQAAGTEILARSPGPLCTPRSSRGSYATMSLKTFLSGGKVFTAGGFGFACAINDYRDCPAKFHATEKSTFFSRRVFANLSRLFGVTP
jgi:hypothetical protein